MKKLFFLTILILFHASFIKAQPIISGISTNEINIDTKFNGTKIILFGAKGDAGNIVIAVRGPKKSFLVTKKEKLLGVWYNAKRVKFDNSYSYYSIFSTFVDNPTNRLLSQLELGSKNLKFEIEESQEKINKEKFTLKLVEKLQQNKLYSKGANKIDFLDETLFKVTLDFPKNISLGTYTVEIYLINEDHLISFQSIPIYVNQIGLSAKISNYAHQQPLLYGLLAIIIALAIGWLANYIFARFLGK